jgi:hypothetical protein
MYLLIWIGLNIIIKCSKKAIILQFIGNKCFRAINSKFKSLDYIYNYK